MPKEPTITPSPAPNSQQPVNASAAPAATPPESSQPATLAAGAEPEPEPTPEPEPEKLFPDSPPIFVPPAPVTREEFDALIGRVERLEKLPSIAVLLARG